MKIKKNFAIGLIGLALLAAPIAASAKDNDNGRNNSHQSQSRGNAPAHSFNAPSRNAPAREVAHENVNRDSVHQTMNRSEARDDSGARAWKAAPEAVSRRDWREDRRKDRNDGDRWNHRDDRWNHDRESDYREYGNGGHYEPYAGGTPYYVMPRGYRGGSCAWARHLRNVYYQDRNTGHPGAAGDLLGQLHRAQRNCGGVPYGYNNAYRYWR